MKYKCSEDKCNKLAVWMYMPSSEYWNDSTRFICDDHIKRGCSCNIIEYGSENEEQFKDDLGRLLPCCEFDYSEDGYNVDD